MQQDRAQLPMAPYENIIVEAVRNNQAVVIAGGSEELSPATLILCACMSAH